MKVGIGLPATIPGARPEVVLEWAKRADGGPFSSLGIIDRIAYPNYEPVVTLAAAAAVTRRVRLMTTVLLAPARNAGVLAKEAATLDVLSGGRLTLGLGIGGREDDFRAAPAPFRGRGRRLEEQLALMRRIWAGEAVGDGAGAVGPAPVQRGGPEVLLGGYAPAAIGRVGRLADGFISGGLPPKMAEQMYRAAEEAWRAAGRPGRPRLVTAIYYALGPDAVERGAPYLRHYYGYMGQGAENVVQGMHATPQRVRETLQAAGDLGVDEVMCWPCIAELDQVERLAELAG